MMTSPNAHTHATNARHSNRRVSPPPMASASKNCARQEAQQLILDRFQLCPVGLFDELPCSWRDAHRAVGNEPGHPGGNGVQAPETIGFLVGDNHAGRIVLYRHTIARLSKKALNPLDATNIAFNSMTDVAGICSNLFHAEEDGENVVLSDRTPFDQTLGRISRSEMPKPRGQPEPLREQTARLESVAPPAPVTATPKEMDLAESLPEDAKRTFLSLVSEGNRLHEREETTPSYTATIPVEMADRLIKSGVFRTGVAQGNQRLFVFAEGGLSDGKSPQLAGRPDTKGFSGRVIELDRNAHWSLISQVSRWLGIPSEGLSPCLLVRIQLDRVVLATQHRAADRHGLSLNDISYTVGRFECAAGIPFRYAITELHAKDGKRIIVVEGAQDGVTANKSASAQQGDHPASGGAVRVAME